MKDTRPAFLITIDTEGDNLWSRPDTITTENSHHLPRFQKLCERYRLKPTWLTNYEMAKCPAFREFGLDVIHRKTGEIGMHLHAWNSPPIINDNPKIHYYLIEYPEHVMSEKIKFVTDLLENCFQHKMISHRAGRWALNSVYVKLLVEYGYRVDCSVTPHVSWSSIFSNPNGSGGTDYTTYPTRPYFMDLDRIECEGDSTILEIPVSILKRYSEAEWLRPNGKNLTSMLYILERAYKEKWPYVEFMLHSSELMPEGSPTFRNKASIEGLYDDLDNLFSKAIEKFEGVTLGEFLDTWITGHSSHKENN